MHRVFIAHQSCYVLHVDRKKWSGEKIIASWKTIRAGRNIFRPIKTSLTSLNNTNQLLYMYQLKDKTLQKLIKTVKLLNCKCWVWPNQMFPDLRHYISPSLRSPQRVLQRIKQGWMQPDDRTQIAKQVGPIVWNALSSAKSGFILRYSRYQQQTAKLC